MGHLIMRRAELPRDLPQIHKIRYLVFQIEQGVDPSLEFDDMDGQAQHILAYLDQKAIATARFRLLTPQVAKLERVAVLREFRGLGIGRKLMVYVLELLAESDVSEVRIHAQEPVKAFYQELGFEPEGEIFEEAGIPHIRMKKLLR